MLALLLSPLLLLTPQRDGALLHELQQLVGQAQGMEEGEAINPGMDDALNKIQCQLKKLTDSVA